MTYRVVYRAMGSPNWHHDSYHTERPRAEARAGELILRGLEVRIREVS
jgi:hypothetical protein